MFTRSKVRSGKTASSNPDIASTHRTSPVPGQFPLISGPETETFGFPGQFPYPIGPGPSSELMQPSKPSSFSQPPVVITAQASGDVHRDITRPTSSINVTPAEADFRTRSWASKSSISTHTIRSRLQAEARHAIAVLEIEEKLAKAKKEVQQKILAADLAAIESSTRSRNNSIQSWVHSLPQDVTNAEASCCQPAIPEAVGPLVFVDCGINNSPETIAHKPEEKPDSRPNPIVSNLRNKPSNFKSDATKLRGLLSHTTNPIQIPSSRPLNTIAAPTLSHQCEGIKDLAQAIISLGNKPKPFSLPYFGGKAVDWIAFKQAYYQSHQSCSPSENLARIRSALRGEAVLAVSALLLTAKDPEEVVQALEERFGRPELIVLEELAILKTLPRLQTDLRDLNIISCHVHNMVSILKHLGQNEYLYSPEIYSTILLKLTPLMRMLWTRYAAEHPGEQSKIEKLSDFLRSESSNYIRFGIITQQNFAVNKFQNNYNNSHDKKCQVLVTDVSDTCPFCQSEVHSIKDCEGFKAISVNQRLDFLKKKRICYKCLSTKSHQWRSCINGKICGINNCKRRHHRLLHCATFVASNLSSSSVPCQQAVTNNATCFSLEQEASKGTIELPVSSAIKPNYSVEHPVGNDATYVCSLGISQSPRKVLLKVIPVVIRGPQGEVDTFALLDDGSTATLIDSSVAHQIGAYGNDGLIRIQGVKGMSCKERVQYVSFNIRGKFRKDFYHIRNARSIISLDLSNQTIRVDEINYPHLSDISSELTYEDAKPKILIGAEDWPLTLSKEFRIGTRTQPVASLSNLGWVLQGLSNNLCKSGSEFINNANIKDTSELERLIKEQFQLDSVGITKHPTSCGPLHARALQILESTTNRLPNGSFEAGLLWREDLPYIPDSYDLACSRFSNLERKLTKDVSVAIAYRNFINDIISKGYAIECKDTHQTRLANNLRTWYLPHFAVFHPQKKKIRVVHDAAARTHGVSLNSLLLPGPDLLPSLLGILFRWRQGRIGMIGDIKEMFPQVKVIERDQDMQRFLWRDASCEGPIKEYKMTSMIFGAASSPCTAIYVLRKNAREHEHRYPSAARTIKNTYMDDCVISVNDVDHAAQLVSDTVEMHSLANFQMRGWVSNNDAALRLISPDLRADKSSSVVPLASAISSSCRVLGLIWDVTQDKLMFRNLKSPLSENEKIPTKRSVLSYAMSLYDPLGILSPLTVHSRILLQNAWRVGVSWDEPLPPNQQREWLLWIESISQAKSMNIPRCYVSGFLTDFDRSEMELHVFADASELAYACVAYWRFSEGKDSKLSFIAAKARVTPLKPVSIPRLELQGALLAARLATTIQAEHDVTPRRRVFWIDSMNVLGWLRAEARSLKPFVANRIGEISETSDVSEWRWIPTDLNVADEATRKSSSISTRWVAGPSFLLEPPETWPMEPTPKAPLAVNNGYKIEFKSEFVSVNATDDQDTNPSPTLSFLATDPSRFSSWLRMVRATARAHQFIKIIRNRLNSELGLRNNLALSLASLPRRLQSSHSLHSLTPLNDEDISRAELHVFRRSQEESFPEELRLIRRHLPVKRHSRLLNLSPTLDADGVLRMSGRIAATPDLSTSAKQPAILDGKHRTTRLLVIHYHRKAAHGHNGLVVNEIRQRFWVLRLRNLVRSVSSQCTLCTIRRAQPISPPMSDLPPERLAHHRRPFSFVGLDYMGPIMVAVGRRKEKRYVALFSCLTSRALHLEIVHSLSADAAVMCLRRFIARRGTPSRILSDNGTAFVGAHNILLASYQECFGNECAQNHISWRFIPPGAPNMGGAWERMVRTVKVALKAVLNERVPREELLYTVLTEVEAVINSRPLTDIPNEPEAPEALTPFHFLIGSSSPFHPIKTEEVDLLSRSDWRKSQRLADMFWSRWIKEYLPLIAPRRSPRNSSPQNFQVGDLVLIADASLPRGTWPRGRISVVHPGRDGIIRVVEVTTRGSVLRRPVNKLVKLPVNHPSPDDVGSARGVEDVAGE